MKRLTILILCILSTISAMCQLYNDHDKSKLRAFLSQPSAVPSKTNGEQLGLTVEDMSTWESDELWVPKVTGLAWDRTSGRLRYIGTGWTNKSLSGELDLSGCVGLSSYVYVEVNQLTSVNISGCTSLTRLDCDRNQLTSLDVSGLPSLTELRCHTNQLTSLNISGCTVLTNLLCHTNKLPALDVSSNTALSILRCYGNPLGTLDVTRNPALSELDCYNNLLSTLDLSNNPSLTHLECIHNQLTSLKLSNKPVLRRMQCFYNQLTTLDVSGCPVLTILTASFNQLTTLDVSHNLNLTMLQIWGCPLTDLTIGWTSPLEAFSLTSLDVMNKPSVTLHVPVGSVSAFRSPDSWNLWKDFGSIVEVVSLPDPPVPPVDPAPVDPAPIDPPVPPVDPSPIDPPVPPVDPDPVDPIDPEVPSSTIDLPSSSISLSLFNSLLLVTSPSSESLTLHSLSGSLLLQASKEKGSTGITIGHLPKGVLIVRGSSGWVRKVFKQ